MRIAPAVRNTSEEQWKEMREGINKRRRLKKEGRKAEAKVGVGCDSKYCNPYKWLAKVEKLTEELKAAKANACEGGELEAVDLLIAACEEKLR